MIVTDDCASALAQTVHDSACNALLLRGCKHSTPRCLMMFVCNCPVQCVLFSGCSIHCRLRSAEPQATLEDDQMDSAAGSVYRLDYSFGNAI